MSILRIINKCFTLSNFFEKASGSYKNFKSFAYRFYARHCFFGAIFQKCHCHIKSFNSLCKMCSALMPIMLVKSAFKGGCCVFVTSDCSKRIREKTYYFRNKSFPGYGHDPFQCLLKIKPLQDVCWVCTNLFYLT